MDKRTIKWDRRYLELALFISTWSKDPSTKVGAVLVGHNNRILATGYNGFVFGADDDDELYQDRVYKYRHVVHAEANALMSMNFRSVGATMYCTMPPCFECTKKIVYSECSNLVCLTYPEHDTQQRWTDDYTKAREYAYENKLDWIEYDYTAITKGKRKTPATIYNAKDSRFPRVR